MTRHYICAPKGYQLPVLFASMVRHCQPFVLHALCWDFDHADFDMDDMREGACIEMVSRTGFLSRHPELATLPGPPRNTNETVCSVRWRYALDVMEATGGQPVCVIDGDQHFFGSPEPMFEEVGDAPYALSMHNFAPASAGLPGVTQESHRKFGFWNGGFSIWRDPAPLREMAGLAEAWCYQDFHDVGGRQLYGDQGSLELITERFPGGDIIRPQVNAGPWNVNRWKLEDRDGDLYLDDRPLISFHYQSLVPGGQLFDPSYAVTPDRAALIYPPYLRALGG